MEYYRIIHDAARKEFNEETGFSLQSYMTDCYIKSLDDCPPKRRGIVKVF
jgi:8-oxo-dGTP pyrophosphatase MutT (NUDIX family)